MEKGFISTSWIIDVIAIRFQEIVNKYGMTEWDISLDSNWKNNRHSAKTKLYFLTIFDFSTNKPPK